MKDIVYQELESNDKNVKVAILMYTGSGDPSAHLDEAVRIYVDHDGYNEFIDANMDNPWVRVIIKGMNKIKESKFDSRISRL